MKTKKTKRFLVTGGAGFIGHHLVSSLIKGGHHVIVLDDLSSGKKERLPFRQVSFIKVDVSEENFVENFSHLFKNVDTVFHLAALPRVEPSIEDPITFNTINVNGTLNVLEAARKGKVKRVVYSATSACYGDAEELPTSESCKIDPKSPYGLQKYIGEQYCKLYSSLYGIDTVSLRYFNVYGQGMATEGAYLLVLGVFKAQLQQGKNLTLTNDGEQRRDFVHVDDVVSANISAALREEEFNGLSINIGSGVNYSVNEIADMFHGVKTYGEVRIEPFETLADNNTARTELKWSPEGHLPTFIKTYKY